MAERWRRVETLFIEAIEKPLAERASFLDQTCSSDHALRREIDSLLEHENLARSFLESDGSGPHLTTTSREPVPPGERVGPYTILGSLGRGRHG